MKNFRSIDLPKLLVDEIEQWVKNKEIPYNTVTSFVEHATRQLRDLTKEQIIDERRHKAHIESLKD